MKNARKTWLLSNDAGWDPRFYEGYFATPLGAAIRRREEEALFDFLGTVMRPRHSVLEVGCGTGNYTVPVALRCARVEAVDASPEMLGYMRERLSREGLTNVETRPGRLPDGLGTPEKFDGVLTVGVLNYVEHFEEALRSLVAPLKPGGWAVFTVPLSTAEGRIYALAELINRRRVYLHSLEETVELAEKAGMRVEKTATAGLGRRGLTLAVGARYRR